MHTVGFSRFGLCALLLAAVSSECARDNLCFTAHARTTLSCRAMPAENVALAVYDDGESAQRARTLHYKKGKLCETKRCQRCVGAKSAKGVDKDGWVACGKAAKFPVRVMTANGDLPRVWALAMPITLLLIAIGTLFAALRFQRKSATAVAKVDSNAVNGGAGNAEVGWAAKAVGGLLRFAALPWFPFIAGFATGLNMFTIVLTGATVVLFIAAVLGRPSRWFFSAVVNAVGATLGSALILYLIGARGDDFIADTFPQLLTSPAWLRAMGLMQQYGVSGMLLVACLPILLHPVIVFGLVTGMSDTSILLIVLSGRIIKYTIMAWVTSNAPELLRFFGVKASMLAFAADATASRKADKTQ